VRHGTIVLSHVEALYIRPSCVINIFSMTVIVSNSCRSFDVPCAAARGLVYRLGSLHQSAGLLTPGAASGTTTSTGGKDRLPTACVSTANHDQLLLAPLLVTSADALMGGACRKNSISDLLLIVALNVGLLGFGGLLKVRRPYTALLADCYDHCNPQHVQTEA
jgi:hypothetical protein